MKSLIAVTILLLVPGMAFGAKSCEELKTEIAGKLNARGIQFYSLEIVPNEKVKDPDKVIGSCDGGKAKILYSRTPATTAKPADAVKTSAKDKP